MNKINTFKIVVIVSPEEGVQSVTVHSKEFTDRIRAYSLCEKLEPNFRDINKTILTGQGAEHEQRTQR